MSAISPRGRPPRLLAMVVAFLSVAIGLTLLVIDCLGGSRSGVIPGGRCGTVPDWVAAIGTGGATLFIAITYERDRALRRQQLADDRQAQANRVVAWVEVVRPGPDPGAFDGSPAGLAASALFNEHPAAIIGNTSDQPVFDVLITVRIGAKALEARRRYDADNPDQIHFAVRHKTAPPGATAVRVPGIPMNGVEEDDVEIEFTDSAGRRWRRAFGGLPLEEVTTPRGSWPHWRAGPVTRYVLRWRGWDPLVWRAAAARRWRREAIDPDTLRYPAPPPSLTGAAAGGPEDIEH